MCASNDLSQKIAVEISKPRKEDAGVDSMIITYSQDGRMYEEVLSIGYTLCQNFGSVSCVPFAPESQS